jgi:Carbohydrate esterase, sialic acid-specific acetylesterase
MKKYILTLLCLFLGFYVVLGQAPTVSWPANYAVFQRNTTTTGGSSNVDFSGQIFSGYSTAKYRIEKLSKTGTFVSDYKAWQNLPTGSVAGMGTSTSALFHFTLASIPTGWYRFSIKNNAGTTTSIKFGVGEVFVIAGQSNAEGFGDYYNVSTGLSNLDCVTSFKVLNSTSNYNGLERPIFGPLNNNNSVIGPTGSRPWFYQYLGEKIVNHEGTNTVIPVCFFNTAASGSSIDNWKTSLDKTKAMFSNSYANSLVAGTTNSSQNPWGFSSPDDRFPYINLKNVLSYYCNLLGVRSVLWHQGEAETKQLLTGKTGAFYRFNQNPVSSNFGINLYASKLNALITDTRAIIPDLTWSICKVSLTSETVDTGGALHANITNSGLLLSNPQASPTSYSVNGSVTNQQLSLISSANKIVWASQNSDTYTAPTYRGDGTHFNANGLKAIADEIYGTISNILNKAPYLPKPILKINYLGKSGSNYNFSLTNNFTIKYLYPFVPSFTIVPFQQNLAMSSSNTSSNYNTYQTGFAKDGNGRIYLSTVVTMGGISNLREANITSKMSNIYPNSLVNNENLIAEFDLENDSNVWIEVFDEKANLITKTDEVLLPKGKQSQFVKISANSTNYPVTLYIHLYINGIREVKRIIVGE